MILRQIAESVIGDSHPSFSRGQQKIYIFQNESDDTESNLKVNSLGLILVVGIFVC